MMLAYSRMYIDCCEQADGALAIARRNNRIGGGIVSRTVSDRLLDLCEYRAEEISKRWYKDVRGNPRNPSYRSLPEERCIPQAVSLYKNLKQMYFAKNPYQEVLQFFERKRYAEVMYAEGVPLHEAIYALILMRRHIWLFAELHAVFSTAAIDLYQMVESVNRVVLLFDYAIYIVTQQYQEMTGRKA